MMSVEIDKIFSATAQSPWHFLNISGQGIYIPAYQRPYSWDRDNVDRLLEDAMHGIGQLTGRTTTISFLGTVIAIHDTKLRTVSPIYRQHVAPRVMTIIDGQQRLCTFVMLNIAFHDALRRLSKPFEKQSDEHFKWLNEQCQILLADLEKTYQLDMTTPANAVFRFYPRITRAYDDAWSRNETEARYESPISRLIWEYIRHSQDAAGKQFKYAPADDKGHVAASYKPVVDVFSYIQKEIMAICGKKAEEYGFSPILKMSKSENFAESIWGYAIPDATQSFLGENSDHKLYSAYCDLFRIYVLAKYMNYRMALTIVTTESEDDAFDMFEALNTTGEPLTAYETFKPLVIAAEKLDKFQTSPSRKDTLRIEQYLEIYRKAEVKQKATSEMLIPFALAERGEKLQKRLNEQRRFLREEFDGLKAIEEKRDFVRSLANLASFMRNAWDIELEKTPEFDPAPQPDSETAIAFQALRHLKHGITVAPLTRFYDEVWRAGEEDRTSKGTDFLAAVKATAAFSMLWRGAMAGTENIDAVYRDIMRTGVTYKDEAGTEVAVPPLAKRPLDGTGVVSLANYKRALRQSLLKHFATKEDWIKAAARTPIYDHSEPIAKFLLMVAAHDAVPDQDHGGLLAAGRPGVAPMLDPKLWNDQSVLTVEHIAPQNGGENWSEEITDEPDRVHRLGNLTLLPQTENSIVGNKPWAHKRLFYRMLSADTEADQQKIIEEAARVGLTLSNKAKKVVVEGKHLGMLKSLTGVETWDADFIERRSRRFAELIWVRLAPWLDLDV